MNRVFYAILIIVGVSIMVMPLSVPVFKSNADYSFLNTGWNGLSSFGKLIYSRGDIVPVMSTYDSISLGEKKGTLVVVGPSLEFTSSEVDEVRDFLNGGGVLILADDFGTGNGLLEGLGLDERFARGEMISPIYSKNHHHPVTAEIVDPELGKDVERIVMTDPSVITNPSNPLVYTPNSTIFGKMRGPFALVDEVAYGKGRIILISDPDIFTNALFAENRAFIENLLDTVEGPFYIDEAHHADLNPYSSGTMTIRRAVNRENVFYYLLFVLALAFFIESGLWARLLEWGLRLLFRILGEEKPESLEEIVKSLEEEGLNRDLLLKIIREIETGSKLGG